MAVLSATEAAPRLQQEYRDGRLIPFLGAGFSKPLKLPDWRELIGSHVEGALLDAGRRAAVLSSFDDFQTRREPGACEVIKFHGTLAKPDTIVLTESSYFQRMALESPVDQRLRADLLSHSFLFMGYSFNDLNIRYVWYRMHQLRLQGQAGTRRPSARRCFFATFGVGPIQPELLEQWNIDMIQLDPSDKEASVADLLQRIR